MPDVMFNGADGRLEGRYHHSVHSRAPLALVLHPHPQFGGTMNNKVVYNLFHVFRRLGFSVLRFNFRGVGRSQGGFDNGQGELSDAASALDWMQAHNPSASECWVSGFSFGTWIAMQLLMRRPEITGFVGVSTPANHYDFSFLAPCPSSGLLVHGEADEIVPESAAAKLVHRLSQQKQITLDYRTIRGADHYFKDRLDDLTAIVEDYLSRRITRKAAAAG